MSQLFRPNLPERLASIVRLMQEKHPRPIIYYARRYYFVRDDYCDFGKQVAYSGEVKRLIKADLLVRVRRRTYLSPLGLEWAQKSLRQLVAWLELEIERQGLEELREREEKGRR